MKKLKIAICSLLVLCSCLMLSACGEDQPKTLYVGDNMTFAQAVECAEDGDIIKLEKDIILSEQIKIDEDVIIDLGGYTISNTTDIWNTSTGEWSLISIDDCNVTIKNGTLQAKENDCYALDIRDEGKLTIESGTYIGNVHAVYVYEGELIVKGGEFDIQQLSEVTHDSRYTLNCYDANYKNGTAKITVMGGKFANYNPEGSTSEYPTAKFLAEGYEVSSEVVGGDTWYTVSKIEE